MLTSPISMTIQGTARSLARVNNDNFGSTYRASWLETTYKHELVLTIRNSYQGKAGPSQLERHNVELKHSVTNNTNPGVVPSVSTAYCVILSPRTSDSVVASDALVALNVFSTANIAALVNWES